MTVRSPLRRSVVVEGDLEALRDWATEVETWPAGSHRWGQYAEQTAMGQSICRTENVSACHPGMAGLVGGVLAAVAASALGVEVVGFKDKINFKQPGGAGFSPHQDLAAYPGASRVMSILVAIDECTRTSGCIWFASGVDELLRTDDRGVVVPEVVESLSWSPAELAPGDALCIAGLTPHYSLANKSTAARRVLVASYAPHGDGYDREGYYSARQREMAIASARDDQFRISTLGDFEGTQVTSEATGPIDACWHR
ncbi:MAG TPA: phytanoyl-CoA dioxygenase family protein [Acidimicrobiales bacterium]|nr:phytanoyl-CoA dioxygenase family protein [Acidimicrobiales bacterium]